MPIDAPFNQWLVGVQGETIVIMRPPRVLTHQEALELAAWLIVMVPNWELTFPDILRAVENS